MSPVKLTMLLLLLTLPCLLSAQESKTDSIINIPSKYIKQIDTKVDKYYSRLTSKTEKTLEKLSKWENKIHHLLLKVNPDAAERLFNSNQITFAKLLEQYKQGKTIAANYGKQYDEYRDKLTSTMSYISEKKGVIEDKYIKPATEVKEKINSLDSQVTNTEAIQQIIKERKKQLIDQCVQYIGKSKYLKKINAESWYYVETLRNYKEIFSDSKKTEEVVLAILKKTPAFQQFFRENSQLASRLGLPIGGSGSGAFGLPGIGAAPVSYNGLQSRVAVQQAIQQRTGRLTASSVANLQEKFRDAMQSYSTYKNKLEQNLQPGNDAFPIKHINTQHTKTFRQRLDFRFNVQFGKASNQFPSSCNTGLMVGYKLNDKSTAGVGMSYILGMGKDWKNIKLTNEGLGLRSFLEYKTGKSFYLHGAAEWNYMSRFGKVADLYKTDKWQRSILAGLSKKITLKNGLSASMQLLYDFLYQNHTPATSPFVYRIGYNF
jgi:hypothetical protein